MPTWEDRERFIPFSKAEIVARLCGDGVLDAAAQAKLQAFCRVLESLYHFQFHQKLEALKDAYEPFNPDREGHPRAAAAAGGSEKPLVAKLEEVLNDANFERISNDDLSLAMREESLFHVSLHLDLEDFQSQVLYFRGEAVTTVAVKRFWFWRRALSVPIFGRVVMLVRFKDAAYFGKRRKLAFAPGSMVLKLFKNVPKADLEMLFPNSEVRMKTSDKLFLGVPTLAGAIGVFVKTSAALVSGSSVLWLLFRSEVLREQTVYPSARDMALIIAALTAVAALVGYVAKLWSGYKNRRILFMKTLTDNLYFKNLDNNVGVFHYLIDSAEEEECKEAMLAYYFLLVAAAPLDSETLDTRIETWFEEKHGARLDFEVGDAMRKLRELGLCREVEGRFAVLDIDAGCRRLDEIWDNIFRYNV